VQGDVLTEVHRFHGENHMVISVGEVARTLEGKHLPKSFSVTTWDKAGAIVTARQVLQEWKRVDGVDLPVRILAAINKNDGSRTVEEITFANHQLLKGDSQLSITELPAIKVGVTSAGAAVANGNLYLYGGHTGPAHSYSADLQSGSLLRLNLAKPEAWEEVSQGPKRTGLAMVGYKGHVYRIGGWESRNDKVEERALYSTKDFARFDPATDKWTELTPLPRGRSSHDAALVGDHLYVVGGWELNGEGDGDWHTTALVCDLSQDKLTWKEIAKPNFMRRALAVAGYQGKLYVLGGMTSDNEVTQAVSIYDPKSDQWSTGPNLPGSGMATFGPSAFGGNEGLFCTVQDGSVLRLSDDGKSWENLGSLKHPRFFHRLVIADDQQLLFVAGTTRGGKVTVTESVRFNGAKK
jgi:N-acetylneuraminic acid mutarotase